LEGCRGWRVARLWVFVLLEPYLQDEDWNGLDAFVGITNYSVQFHQTVFHGFLQSLFDFLVNRIHIFKPHQLRFSAAPNKRLIGGIQNIEDILENGLEFDQDLLPMFLLLLLELADIIGLLLIDANQQLRGNLLALHFDLLGVGLEHLQLAV
jgi:hypothetical protein